MARGGARTPASPAAVSGPGAHSQRTDGGPADKKLGRADLAAAGGGFGDRKAIEDQAASAPVVTGGGTGTVAPSATAGPGGDLTSFGPTQRPNEPITAGVPVTPGEQADTELMLRALYAQFPTPYVGRLLNG